MQVCDHNTLLSKASVTYILLTPWDFQFSPFFSAFFFFLITADYSFLLKTVLLPEVTTNIPAFRPFSLSFLSHFFSFLFFSHYLLSNLSALLSIFTALSFLACQFPNMQGICLTPQPLYMLTPQQGKCFPSLNFQLFFRCQFECLFQETD